MGAEHRERLLLVDGVAGHEDAFGLFDDGAASERALQVVELGEAVEDDVDRAPASWSGLGVGDVGEDAAFGCLVDEGRVACFEQGDDGAGGFVDDV